MRVSRDEAFSAFVVARYYSLVRTARLLAGSGSQAEDLVQEALLRTYRAWSRIGRVEAAEAYTRTTMVRLLIKNRRRRWHAETPVEYLPEVAHPGHEDQAVTAMTMRTMLAVLPPAQRAVVVLRYYHDLSEQEIATVLGCSHGTVKSRASRALSTLRAQGLPAAASSDRDRSSTT
jgi:RNA polymerase sigma-70 factor (sigma-E family)